MSQLNALPRPTGPVSARGLKLHGRWRQQVVAIHVPLTLPAPSLAPHAPLQTAAASAPMSVPPALLTGVARLLATADSQAQLQALLAGSGRLAKLAAPYSRAQRCQEVRRTGLSQQVSAGAGAPWCSSRQRRRSAC